MGDAADDSGNSVPGHNIVLLFGLYYFMRCRSTSDGFQGLVADGWTKESFYFLLGSPWANFCHRVKLAHHIAQTVE